MTNGHDDIRLLLQAEASWLLFCERLFNAAVSAVLPEKCLRENLPNPHDYNAVKVIAFGKAAVDMATVVEQQWAGIDMSGIVICPYGNAKHSRMFDVVEASHPLPDENSVEAAKKALSVAESAGPDELLLVLVSGGGSALMAKPVCGVSLNDKRQTINHLLRAGATIDEINHIRCTISAVKGGKLLLAAKSARSVVTLVISDVVNDCPSTIASGPSVILPDEDDWAIADKLLKKYKVPYLKGFKPQPPADLTVIPKNTYKVIANGSKALAAAEAMLQESGCEVVNLGYDIEGEARVVAVRHAELILKYKKDNLNGAKPVAFLSGGELTVTVTGGGAGGPNQEYVLAMMQSLPQGEYYAFAADTDGLDGVGDAAGAFFTPETYSNAKRAQLNSERYLIDNNSYSYFNKLNCIFKVKHNVVNVNDFRVVIWLPQQ